MKYPKYEIKAVVKPRYDHWEPDAVNILLAVQGRQPRLNAEERRLVLAELDMRGWTDRELARWLGTTVRTIVRTHRMMHDEARRRVRGQAMAADRVRGSDAGDRGSDDSLRPGDRGAERGTQRSYAKRQLHTQGYGDGMDRDVYEWYGDDADYESLFGRPVTVDWLDPDHYADYPTDRRTDADRGAYAFDDPTLRGNVR